MDRRLLNIQDKCHSLFNNRVNKTSSFKPVLSYNSVKICYFSDRSAGFKINYEILLKNIFGFLNQLENLNSLDIFLNFFAMSKNNRHCHYEKCYFRNQSFTQLKSMKVLKIVLGGRELSCLLSLFLDLMPELVHIEINLRTHWEGEQLCLACSREKLFNYLNEGKNRIKTFILHADPETMKRIPTIEGMNLETMSLPSSFEHHLNFTDPNKILHLHPFNDKDLDLICKTFPNLQTISVRCPKDTKGIKGLKNLKVI